MKQKVKWPIVSTIILLLLCLGLSANLFVFKDKEYVADEAIISKDYVVVLVKTENCETCKTIEEKFDIFVKNQGEDTIYQFNKVNYLDPMYKDILYMYNVTNSPSLFVLDRNGILIDKKDTFTDDFQIVSYLSQAVAEYEKQDEGGN